MRPNERRIAQLEAQAPEPPSPYDLHRLTDDELIVLATAPATNGMVEPETLPEPLRSEVERILSKASRDHAS
ncbi:hypothetical protein ACH0BU_13685 [Sphingomonas olei]